MIDKTTLKDLCQKMAGTFKKFTTSACFMIAAAIMSVVLIHLGDKIDGKDSFFLMFWTITAGLLNLVVKLVLTDWRNDERHTVKPLWFIAVNALWLGVCLAFRQAWPLDLSWTNAAVTLVGIIVSGIFIAPVFQKSNNDMRLWNYIIDCTSAFATAFAVGVLLAGGLELLVLAFNVLFGVEIGWKVFADVFLVCMIFVAPMVFMQLIPEKERHDTERPGTTGLGLINYLIFPLFGTYVVTLYVYAVKILFEWKLPCGWVSTLVMASMICLILMMFLLYPVQFRKEDNKWRFDRKALKLLPAIFLPLLILMTVGIAKRITDYGITAPRLYVVLFNVWGYAVCIGLTVSKCKRFRWIPLSFLVLAALSSVGPQNFSAISRRVLVSEVKKALSSNCPGINFPLDSAKYSEIMKSGDIATMIETDEKMEYLYIMYPERVVREIVDTTVGFWNFGLMQMDTVEVDECGSHWIEINTKGASIIPKGFTRFENINFNGSVPLADTAFVTVSSDSVTLTIPVSEIDTAQKENGCKPLYFYGDGGVFFTNNISIDSEGKNDMNVQLSGIIFLK